MTPDDTELDFEVTRSRIAAGRKFFGRYTLDRELGRGGMGLVWLALDEKLNEQVALKFLPDLVARDREAVAELKEETLCCRKLRHPGIVAVYGFEEADGAAAIVMEYVEGDTFSDVKLEQPDRIFEVAQITSFVQQLCDALTHAHRDARLVHRDIKPRNLMLDSNGRLKLMDFGLARTVADSLSRVSVKDTGSCTPPYASPQQASGRPATVADDVYSIGATLYDLLTGKPPFIGAGIYERIKTEVPPRVTERRAELGIGEAPIPQAWDDTIAACLEKDPAKRPQSVAELWERLNAPTPAATSAPMQPTEPLEMEEKERTVPVKERPDTGTDTKRKPLLIAAVAAVVAVLLAVGIRAAMHGKQGAAGSALTPAASPASPEADPEAMAVIRKMVGEEQLISAWNAVHEKTDAKAVAVAANVFSSLLKNSDPVLAYQGEAGLAAIASIEAGGGVQEPVELYPVPTQPMLGETGYASASLGPYGFIDRSGKLVIPATFKDASAFSEGLAAVRPFKAAVRPFKEIRILNVTKDIKPDFDFTPIDDFAGVSGFIDRTGKLVIPYKWTRPSEFSEGLAAVASSASYLIVYKREFINRTGELAFSSTSTEPFKNSS